MERSIRRSRLFGLSRSVRWSARSSRVFGWNRLSKRHLGGLAAAGALVVFTAVGAAGDVVVSDSAERVSGGQPVGWGLYHGKGDAAVTATADAHSGNYAVRLRAQSMGEWREKSYLNVGLMFGRTRGYDGSQAFAAAAGVLYRIRFWMKGTAPWTRVMAVCWVGGGTDAESRRSVNVFREPLHPEAVWQSYEGWFRTPPRTTRLAIKWQLAGFADDGMAPGELIVDDVTLEDVGRLTPERQRLQITDRINPMVRKRPLGAVLADLRAGRHEITAMVDGILAQADRWVAKSDSWHLTRTPVHTPLGMWTVACPFHPERVRDFSKDNFLWDVDQPWRLVCPLCRAEGRELFYYPNERYPDDGSGCYPSDEIWSADHGAAWSRAHGNIPYDHWDGKAHGYSRKGYCYHFIGKCAHEMMTFGAREMLPALAEAYVLAPHVDGVSEARRNDYARTVKIILFSLARAHLGDAYLRDVENVSEGEWTALLDAVYTDDPEGLRHRVFPGFKRYDLQDGVEGNADHPAHPRRSDIYGDGSFRGDAYASGWLQSYALVRNAFGAADETMRRMTERILIAAEHDAEALRDKAHDPARSLKPGKLDLALEPYTMTVGHSNNLGGRELANQFDLGVLLDDHEIVDTVVQNAWFYLRNYFNADGLGRETSPAYTNCAWNCMRMIFDRIDGYRGSYDETHPWWDGRRKALNPYLDPEMAYAAAQAVFCLYPDGTTIPWMDSHAGHGLQMRYLERIHSVGIGIPEELRRYYQVTDADDGVSVEPRPEALPSRLLHESRKAVIRLGEGEDRALLSLDYALDTGHYHPAPMDLVLFAKGHELASDLGYFGAMHWLTRDWIRTCPAHNTCLIRDDSGDHEFIHQVQGDMRTIWHADETVGVIEVAETDADDLAHIPGDHPAYSRTVVMLATADQPDVPASHYVIDLFRLRGGRWHDYMFHSQGARCTAPGLPLEALDPERSLHEVSGFTDKGEQDRGIGRIDRLRRITTAEDITVVWQDVSDFSRNPVARDPDVGLRLTLLGRSGKTDLFLGQAPGERRMSNVDREEPLHVLCARRKNTSEMNVFAALIEPFRERPVVGSIAALPLEQAPDGGVALAVSYGRFRDVICSVPPCSEPGALIEATVPGVGALSTDARMVVVRCSGSDVEFIRMFGGTETRVGDVVVRQRPSVRAELIALDPLTPALVVESRASMPEGDALAGDLLLVTHAYGSTTFTLGSVEAIADHRYRLCLAARPRLFDNLFRVTRRLGPMMAIEPPPSLPRHFETLGYHLFAQPTKPEPQYAARITGFSRGLLTLDTAPGSIHDGDTIGVTRLCPGRDQVLIPAWTEWTRRR